MGKAIRASMFVLLLACSTYAGDIQNGSPTQPPPNVAGWIHNDSPAPADSEEELAASGYTQNDVAGALAEAALVVLNSGVLALL